MSNFSNFSNQPYRYILDKSSKKHYCPNCNKKSFVLYIDTVTGDYLPEQYGRCDRENKCSYHLNPYLDGYAKSIWEQEQKVTKVTKVTVPTKYYFSTQPKPQPEPKPVFFDFDTFKRTLQTDYENNVFIQNLFSKVPYPFEPVDVIKVIELYRLGTIQNGYRAGAITFPFIDIAGNVRAVQVKQFDEANHTTGTDFLHSILIKYYKEAGKVPPEWLNKYINQDKKVTCLFGEHLLSKYPNNPIALVEAPKTAIYGTLYFGLPENPTDLIWLAVYNKSSFSLDKVKPLQGRFVYVFPDLSKDGDTFKEWETKAKEFERQLPKIKFIFSDLLEQLAPENDKKEGNDLADYLIKQDWRLFRKRNIKEPKPQPEPEKVTKVTKVTHQQNIIFSHVEPLSGVEVFKTKQPQNWSNDIAELENYFASIELPTQPIKLNSYSIITDCSLFIESHFATVKANNGNRTFLPYLNRLQELKQVLTMNSKGIYE